MALPAVIAAIFGLGGAGLAWLLVGGAGAYAILSNATTIAYIIAAILGLFLLKKLVR